MNKAPNVVFIQLLTDLFKRQHIWQQRLKLNPKCKKIKNVLLVAIINTYSCNRSVKSVCFGAWDVHTHRLAVSLLAGRHWAKQPETRSEKKQKNHREAIHYNKQMHRIHQERHFAQYLWNCRLPQRCLLRRNWGIRYTERTVHHDRSRPPPSLLQRAAAAGTAVMEAEISRSS